MSRTKEEMREARQRKIEHRRHLLSHLDHAGRSAGAEDGYFANSGEISKYITAENRRKLKPKMVMRHIDIKEPMARQLIIRQEIKDKSTE